MRRARATYAGPPNASARRRDASSSQGAPSRAKGAANRAAKGTTKGTAIGKMDRAPPPRGKGRSRSRDAPRPSTYKPVQERPVFKGNYGQSMKRPVPLPSSSRVSSPPQRRQRFQRASQPERSRSGRVSTPTGARPWSNNSKEKETPWRRAEEPPPRPRAAQDTRGQQQLQQRERKVPFMQRQQRFNQAKMRGSNRSSGQQAHPKQNAEAETKRGRRDSGRNPERSAAVEKKRGEDVARRQEHAATLNVRKFLQRITKTTNETSKDDFDSLAAEARKAMEDDFEKMGSLAEGLSQELESAITEAESKIDKFEAMTKDCVKLFDEAESKVAKTADMVALILDDAKVEAEPDSALEALQGFEAAVEVAFQALDAALRQITLTRKEFFCTEKTVLWEDLGFTQKVDFMEHSKKIFAFKATLTKLRGQFALAKSKAIDRATALSKEKRRRDLFAKYDKKGEEYLSREDVAAMAKTEYGLTLEGSKLDQIYMKASDLTGALCSEHFEDLCSLLDLEIEAAREAEIEVEKTKISNKFEGARALLDNAQEAATKADGLVKAVIESASTRLSSEDLKKMTDDMKGAIARGTELLNNVSKLLTGTMEEENKNEVLAAHYTAILEEISSRQDEVQVQINDSVSASEQIDCTALITRAKYAELDETRMKVALLISDFCASKDKKVEQLHADAASNGEHTLEADGFIAMMKEMHEHTGETFTDQEKAQYSKYFAYACKGGDALTLEGFLEIYQLHYSAVKATIFSEERPISSAKIRRLDEGETVERLERAQMDETSRVVRMRCRATQDNKEGWVSVAGDRGTVYFTPCYKFFLCAENLTMMQDLEGSKGVVRDLAQGDIIEVIEYHQKTSSINQAVRVKIKLLSSGEVGWVEPKFERC